MFDKKLIPAPNPQLKQHLQTLYEKSQTSNDIRSIIDKKIEKVNQAVKDKIVHTVTISDYFNQLWKQPDLKQNDKDTAIKKLEKIQKLVKVQIEVGDQLVASTSANLNVLNAGFQMTPFEEFNYQEKIKGIKKHKQLDIDSDLFSNHASDKEVLHALNRAFRSVPNLSAPAGLHYTAGLCDIDETDEMKKQKAGEFVKKIKEEKKIFVQKIKQAEKSLEARELAEFEIFRQREKQEQEQREKEKRARLEAHIKELKGRNDSRVKEASRWEEEYKAHREKKPLFKEIEQKYKKEQLLPELEDKKRKLQELRAFHKPMVREELLEHEKKVLKQLEEKEAERKEKIFENSRWIYQKPAYESKHHKSYADEISKARHQKEGERMELLKKKEKVIELLQEVKEKHLPRADPEKEMELLAVVEKLKKRKDWRLKVIQPEEPEDDDIDRKKLGAEYLKSVKEMVAKKRKNAQTSSNSRNDISATALMSDRNKRLAGETSQSDTAAIKPRNYLAELRKENKIHDRVNHVDVIINNKKLDANEKKKMLQSEVEKLEEKTKRREEVKKFRVRKNITDIAGDEDAEEVDMLAHLEGKLHTGFAILRRELENLKKRREELRNTNLSRNKDKEKERDRDHDKGRERDHDRSEDRHRSRRKRSSEDRGHKRSKKASRSRSRSNRRRDSRDRDRKSRSHRDRKERHRRDRSSSSSRSRSRSKDRKHSKKSHKRERSREKREAKNGEGQQHSEGVQAGQETGK